MCRYVNCEQFKEKQMIKKYNHDTSNISNAVSMILKSAKKRRALAISAAKSINSETGLGNKLIAIK